ncbi:hypothetical protein NYO67_7589 [Aspergillus flavus]|nr:hypothetical protein NYO67_7589 [Aspergillus flavus]
MKPFITVQAALLALAVQSTSAAPHLPPKETQLSEPIGLSPYGSAGAKTLYTAAAIPDVPHRGLEKRAAANPYYKGKGIAIDLPDNCPVPDASWWANEESREDGIRKDSATTVDPLKEFLDVIEAPFQEVEDTVKTFLQGIMDLAKGNTCEGVSETLMPVVHAMIKEFIRVSDETGFKSVLNEIGDEITRFLNYPGIRERWKFLNTRLEDIPVIGLWFKTVGKAEGWTYEHLVPKSLRDSLQSCANDGIRHPAQNPLGFLLALGIDTIEHPTILDILLAIPGVGEFAESIKFAEEAVKGAEDAAKIAERLSNVVASDGVASDLDKIAKLADKADASADAAEAAAGSAKGTEQEAKALEQATKADEASKAADKAFYDGENEAKKLCPRGITSSLMSWWCSPSEQAPAEEGPADNAARSRARRNRKKRRNRRINKKAEPESEPETQPETESESEPEPTQPQGQPKPQDRPQNKPQKQPEPEPEFLKNTRFSRRNVERSIERGTSSLKGGITYVATDGKNTFPHHFSNFENIDFELPNPKEFNMKDLQEFPLTQTVFNTGMQPGPYRTVFAKRIATGEWEAIGVIRHQVGGNTGTFLRVGTFDDVGKIIRKAPPTA